jgi:hypothetical protein
VKETEAFIRGMANQFDKLTKSCHSACRGRCKIRYKKIRIKL